MKKKAIEVKDWIKNRDESAKSRLKTSSAVQRKPFKPMNEGQEDYLEAIKSSIITFCIGPAGSGKTYIPCAYAAELLLADKIKQIVITRPTIGCGKTLGFLPGDLRGKFDPFLGPIFQSFADFMSKAEIEKFIAEERIVIIPIEYMRGLTLKNCVIIVDEANNCSTTDLKMILTRIGDNAKMIISGDINQSDLTPGRIPPLLRVMDKLEGNNAISHIELLPEDVVRHPLIAWIENALYEPLQN